MIASGAEKIREGGFFLWGEFTEDEISVANFGAERVASAEAETGEIRGGEATDNGF